jgi:hypothetical protein
MQKILLIIFIINTPGCYLFSGKHTANIQTPDSEQKTYIRDENLSTNIEAPAEVDPGDLAISSENSLMDSGIESLLGLESGAMIPVGSAVRVSSLNEEKFEKIPSSKLILEIDIKEESASTALFSSFLLGVIYHVTKDDGTSALGLIMEPEIQITSENKIKFNLKGFGIYQAVKINLTDKIASKELSTATKVGEDLPNSNVMVAIDDICSSATPEQVIAGMIYYTCDGVKMVGTMPTCSSDGQTGCITSTNYPAVDKASLMTKVLFGQSVAGVSGAAISIDCQHTDQSSCESDDACRWESGSCEVNPWNIRTGLTLAGTAGSFKGNCRNRANSSIFDTDSMPPGNIGDTSGSTLDWWDTVDNWNGDNNSLPSEQPVGWSAEHYCGKEVWSDLTDDGACDSAADDCLMKDNLTGLIWSESYPVATTAAANTTRDWSAAVEHCESLSYGGRADWRLPTQIEMMTAYNHGIRELGFKGGGTVRPGGDTLDNNSAFISLIDDYFWSSTTRSDAGNTQNAMYMQFTIGYASMNNKTGTHQFLCVAP